MGLDMYLFKSKKVEGKTFKDMIEYNRTLEAINGELPIPKEFEDDLNN